MPHLPNLGHLFGSADAALLDRRTFVLPCSVCSAPGPHSHRLEREWGIVVICDGCDPQVAKHSVQHGSNPLHISSAAKANR